MLSGYYYFVKSLPISPHRLTPSLNKIFENDKNNSSELADIATQFDFRAGISINLRHSGSRGFFSMTSLVLACVTSIALLSACREAIQICMLYVMPLKHFYREFVYDRSVKFSELKSELPAAMAAMEEVSRTNAFHAGDGDIILKHLPARCSAPEAVDAETNEARVALLEAQVRDLQKMVGMGHSTGDCDQPRCGVCSTFTTDLAHEWHASRDRHLLQGLSQMVQELPSKHAEFDLDPVTVLAPLHSLLQEVLNSFDKRMIHLERELPHRLESMSVAHDTGTHAIILGKTLDVSEAGVFVNPKPSDLRPMHNRKSANATTSVAKTSL